MWQIVGFYQEAEKSKKPESDGDANSSKYAWNGPQMLGKET